SMTAATPAGSYEFFDSTGVRYTGAITDAGTVTPQTSSQSFTDSLYRQFTVAGDANLVPGNIKDAVDIFGVASNLAVETHSDCTTNNQVGCVTTTTYKAADLTNLLSGSVTRGVTIAGTAGTYPSLATPLDGATGTS